MVKIVSKLWQWDINNDIVTYVHEKFKLVKSHTHTYTNENKDLKIYLSRVLSYEQTISLKLICRDNVYEDTKYTVGDTELKAYRNVYSWWEDFVSVKDILQYFGTNLCVTIKCYSLHQLLFRWEHEHEPPAAAATASP